MARAHLLAATALLAALLCLSAPASAARIRMRSDSPDGLTALKWAQQLGRREDMPAFMAIKYTIAPCMHETFMDEWMRFEKTLRDAKGLDFYQLTKPTDMNTEFHAYTEWESHKALMEHLE
ncbi:hypothetical protein TSOC_005867 [Tetrabaena socialis]|uniref:ABM domain-containing protein n=1 Tax=Tetrabaena socialis TaxID=47790 RepID=A0A2J8A5B6_9CHLO|nr:hypothetical protein TSOC_005867 [Tetrabaena socialis]|eukprot:PNH07695.1 hypothetical protein TSOC_005867 [Tetrabaena socialis]